MKTKTYSNYSAVIWYLVFGVLSVGIEALAYFTSYDANAYHALTSFARIAIPIYIIGLLLVWFVCELFAALRRD